MVVKHHHNIGPDLTGHKDYHTNYSVVSLYNQKHLLINTIMQHPNQADFLRYSIVHWNVNANNSVCYMVQNAQRIKTD